MGSRKLLPGNSAMNAVSWKNKQNFTEIFLLLIRPNTIPYGQRHTAFDHMEFCLVINLTMGGNWAV